MVILDKGQKRRRCCSVCGSSLHCTVNDKNTSKDQKYAHKDKKTYTRVEKIKDNGKNAKIQNCDACHVPRYNQKIHDTFSKNSYKKESIIYYKK